MNLTPRQSEILKAIIEEYISNAQPVGSTELVERRHLPISGATVRNIMATLVKEGYLDMPHVSSGRVPSDRAYRYYVAELMEEDQVSVLEEISLKQKIWNQRYEIERLLRNTAESLSEVTDSLAFATTDDGYATYTGTSRVFDKPEFFEINVTKSVFRFVDDYELLTSVVNNYVSADDVTVLIGQEIGLANMDPICIIAAKAMMGEKNCCIGIIAPARSKYGRLIPIIRHTKGLLVEIAQNY